MRNPISYILLFWICPLIGQNGYMNWRTPVRKGTIKYDYLNDSARVLANDEQLSNLIEPRFRREYSDTADGYSVKIPLEPEQIARYSFIEDIQGDLRYYADISGVFTANNQPLFQAFNFNIVKSALRRDAYILNIPKTEKKYPNIPNTHYPGYPLNSVSTNCVRFGNSNYYGAFCWDFRYEGIRVLNMNYSKTKGDTVTHNTLLSRLGMLTSVTCGPNENSFWIVGISKNRDSIFSYLWSQNGIELKSRLPLSASLDPFFYGRRLTFSPNNRKAILIEKPTNIPMPEPLTPRNAENIKSILFDFDPTSGKLSNPSILPYSGFTVTFSADSKCIYIGTLDSSRFRSYNLRDSIFIPFPSRLLVLDSTGKLIGQADSIPIYADNPLANNQFWVSPSGLYLNTDGSIVLDGDAKVIMAFSPFNEILKGTLKTYYNEIYQKHSSVYYEQGFYNITIPEIPACKCVESPKQLRHSLNLCSSDTFILELPYYLHDSIIIEFGDGNRASLKKTERQISYVYSDTGLFEGRITYYSPFNSFQQNFNVRLVAPPKQHNMADTQICEGQSYLLNLEESDSRWIWSSNQQRKDYATQSGFYVCVALDSVCGNLQDSVYIDVKPKPQPLSLPDTVLCPNEALVIHIPKEIIQVSWDNTIADSARVKTFNNKGLHTLKYQNEHCSRLDTFVITISEPLKYDIYQRNPNACLRYETLIFDLNIADSVNNTIFWPDYSPYKTTYFTPSSHDFSVRVTDKYDCYEEVIVTPTWRCEPHVYIPNTFTPDQKGPTENEVFLPVIKDGRLVLMQIFNRWGECIYQNAEGWDGTYQGKTVPNGIYTYILAVETSSGNNKNSVQYFNGYVQVLR